MDNRIYNISLDMIRERCTELVSIAHEIGNPLSDEDECFILNMIQQTGSYIFLKKILVVFWDIAISELVGNCIDTENYILDKLNSDKIESYLQNKSVYWKSAKYDIYFLFQLLIQCPKEINTILETLHYRENICITKVKTTIDQNDLSKFKKYLDEDYFKENQIPVFQSILRFGDFSLCKKQEIEQKYRRFLHYIEQFKTPGYDSRTLVRIEIDSQSDELDIFDDSGNSDESIDTFGTDGLLDDLSQIEGEYNGNNYVDFIQNLDKGEYSKRITNLITDFILRTYQDKDLERLSKYVLMGTTLGINLREMLPGIDNLLSFINWNPDHNVVFLFTESSRTPLEYIDFIMGRRMDSFYKILRQYKHTENTSTPNILNENSDSTKGLLCNNNTQDPQQYWNFVNTIKSKCLDLLEFDVLQIREYTEIEYISSRIKSSNSYSWLKQTLFLLTHLVCLNIEVKIRNDIGEEICYKIYKKTIQEWLKDNVESKYFTTKDFFNLLHNLIRTGGYRHYISTISCDKFIFHEQIRKALAAKDYNNFVQIISDFNIDFSFETKSIICDIVKNKNFITKFSKLEYNAKYEAIINKLQHNIALSFVDDNSNESNILNKDIKKFQQLNIVEDSVQILDLCDIPLPVRYGDYKTNAEKLFWYIADNCRILGDNYDSLTFIYNCYVKHCTYHFLHDETLDEVETLLQIFSCNTELVKNEIDVENFKALIFRELEARVNLLINMPNQTKKKTLSVNKEWDKAFYGEIDRLNSDILDEEDINLSLKKTILDSERNQFVEHNTIVQGESINDDSIDNEAPFYLPADFFENSYYINKRKSAALCRHLHSKYEDVSAIKKIVDYVASQHEFISDEEDIKKLFVLALTSRSIDPEMEFTKIPVNNVKSAIAGISVIFYTLCSNANVSNLNQLFIRPNKNEEQKWQTVRLDKNRSFAHTLITYIEHLYKKKVN